MVEGRGGGGGGGTVAGCQLWRGAAGGRRVVARGVRRGGGWPAMETWRRWLPADRGRLDLCATGEGEDWLEAVDAGAAASFSFSAGGRIAVLSGDDVEPGLYETDGTVTAEAPGLRLHAVQFTPAPPAPSGSPGEHEAHVLLDDLELRYVLGPRARKKSTSL